MFLFTFLCKLIPSWAVLWMATFLLLACGSSADIPKAERNALRDLLQGAVVVVRLVEFGLANRISYNVVKQT